METIEQIRCIKEWKRLARQSKIPGITQEYERQLMTALTVLLQERTEHHRKLQSGRKPK